MRHDHWVRRNERFIKPYFFVNPGLALPFYAIIRKRCSMPKVADMRQRLFPIYRYRIRSCRWMERE
jgi:hypothetical protein